MLVNSSEIYGLRGISNDETSPEDNGQYTEKYCLQVVARHVRTEDKFVADWLRRAKMRRRRIRLEKGA